jgi:ligand-binding sensor domain-containing protein
VVNGGFSLSRYDGQRFQTSRAPLAPDARALWTSRAGFLSSANEWWFMTTTRLYRFAAGSFNRPLATYDSRDGFKSDDMYQMFEDSHGDIWLSQQPSRDENIGLYRLKNGDSSFYRFSENEGFPKGKSAESFAEDRSGNLWFGFYEGGLVRFANNRFEEFGSKDGLPARGVTDLLVDRQGRLWLTTTMGGVRRIDDPAAARPVFVSLTTH